MAQEKARPVRARKTEIEKKQAAAGPRRRKRALPDAREAVAFHAYLLWERGEPGGALEHWLRAERETASA
jgi:Protein of unknown function (DUF2934)